MTAKTIIREAQARKIAKIVREQNVAIRVEPDGSIVFLPAPQQEPLARGEEIVL